MSAAEFIPERPTLPRLRRAAAGCRGCHLWEGPIQTVFGEGPAKARLGSSFRLTQRRGELVDSELAEVVAATIHPSAIVRNRDDEARRAERHAFAADLGLVARALSA